MRQSVSTPQGDPVVFDDELLPVAAADHAKNVDVRPQRVLYAASRVVMLRDYGAQNHSLEHPGPKSEILAAIDWERTLAQRQRLDRLGFGIAEAMDTAQRFRLGWLAAEQLMQRTAALRLRYPFIAGAGIDQRAHCTVAEIADAVLEQMHRIASLGGIPIVLPLLPLARARASESDYVRVYGAIIRSYSGPLLLHWLGEMFLPELRGYFPGDSLARILALDPEKVVGIKLSLLDPELEVRLRRTLHARSQFVFTGDDYHFAELLRGGAFGAVRTDLPPIEGWCERGGLTLARGDFSHALLGVFDAVALPVSHALQALADRDMDTYWRSMLPCAALGRALFEKPTEHYKAGLAFLAWLEGLQENYFLVDHEERARSPNHFIRITRLAAEAGVFSDAQASAGRFAGFLKQV